MTSSEDNRDELLEAYLDDQLSDGEKAAFEASLQADPVRRGQCEIQGRVDEALARMFIFDAPSVAQLAATLKRAAPPRTAARGNDASMIGPIAPRRFVRRVAPGVWIAASVAAAAAIAWLATSAPWSRPGRDEPYFAVRPLVDLYRDAVASGFEPSYECREPERFAATFRQRQDRPLQLLAAPAGTHMLGLSYVGGLSRRTTAMLCHVDGQAVMVFVDRAEADQPMAAAKNADGLRVFREERDGLVFYEVTPLAEPRVTQLLAPAEDGSAQDNVGRAA